MDCPFKSSSFFKQKQDSSSQSKTNDNSLNKRRKRSVSESKPGIELEGAERQQEETADRELHSRKKRFAKTTNYSLWPNGTVPYEFDDGYREYFSRLCFC